MRFLDELEDAGDHRLPASWIPFEGLEFEVHVLCLQHQALRDAQTIGLAEPEIADFMRLIVQFLK